MYDIYVLIICIIFIYVIMLWDDIILELY